MSEFFEKIDGLDFEALPEESDTILSPAELEEFLRDFWEGLED